MVSSGWAQTISNPSFEASNSTLSSWQTIGLNTVASSSLAAPANGSYQAMTVAENGLSNSVTATALSNFFGGVALPAMPQGTASNGSGFKQTFTLSAPATLTFSYRYVTGEAVNSGNDSSFYFLNGALVSLASSTSAGLSSAYGVTGYTNGLNYATATISLAAGTHTLGFGVYNTQNRANPSALMVDNLILSSSAIPEPTTTAALAGMAALALAVCRRRR